MEGHGLSTLTVPLYPVFFSGWTWSFFLLAKMLVLFMEKTVYMNWMVIGFYRSKKKWPICVVIYTKSADCLNELAVKSKWHHSEWRVCCVVTFIKSFFCCTGASTLSCSQPVCVSLTKGRHDTEMLAFCWRAHEMLHIEVQPVLPVIHISCVTYTAQPHRLPCACTKGSDCKSFYGSVPFSI